MRVNPNMARDYNFGEPVAERPIEQTIRCLGYENPRAPVDYSPRDKRVWLRACRDMNCPDDRCIDMIEDLVDE